MNKKLVIGLAAVILIVAVIFGMSMDKEEPAPTEAATEAATETAAETTEETVPGVEKSLFDDNNQPMEEATAATTESKPAATVPTGPQSGGDAKEEESKLEDPEPPEKDNSKPKDTKPTEPAEKETEATQPTETQAPQTELTEYEKFQNMKPEDQQAFMESFEKIEDFFAWLEKARAEYEAANPGIPVGDGNINLKDYE